MPRHVNDVVVDLDEVLHAAVDGGERGLKILEGLGRLRQEITGRADDSAGAVEAELAANIDGASRSGRINDVRHAGNSEQRLRVDEVQHGRKTRSVIAYLLTEG